MTIKFSAVVQDIVLARDIKYILCFAALEHLIKRVELLRFRQLCDISSVDEEGRWSGHRVNAIESNFERLRHILVCLFTEAVVHFVDLYESMICGKQRLCCVGDLADGFGRKDSTGNL